LLREQVKLRIRVTAILASAVANALARLGVADAISAAGSAARHSAILTQPGAS
jgi:hypothetical protein